MRRDIQLLKFYFDVFVVDFNINEFLFVGDGYGIGSKVIGKWVENDIVWVGRGENNVFQ